MGVGEAARRWCSPGPRPDALAVGGASFLKAVAGLLVLVNVCCAIVKLLARSYHAVTRYVKSAKRLIRAPLASLCYNGAGAALRAAMTRLWRRSFYELC